MKFILTCGGTAGHINPALAVAAKLEEDFPNSEFLFIGAKGKMEEELVPRAGYNINCLTVTNLSRKFNFDGIKHNINTIINLAKSIIGAKKIIKEFKPDAVIGTGGYVCFPVLFAAHRLGIKTIIHESNATPGLTTKLLIKLVDAVCLGFEDSLPHYTKAKRAVVTGTPVRHEFDHETKQIARQELGISEDTTLVLSVWGSLGAERMNTAVCHMLPRILEDKKFSLVHSTGTRYYDKIVPTIPKTTEELSRENIKILPYIYDMNRWLTAADLVLCRAGASTLAELCYMGKPAVIVPSPNVTANHQEKNARVLEKAGGAVVIVEKELDENEFYNTVCSLVRSAGKLDEMSLAMKSLSVAGSTEKIINVLYDVMGIEQ